MATTVVEGYRLSPQQQRLWHLLRSHSTSHSASSATSYVSQCVLLVRPALDFDLLRRALLDLHGRVELLRTRLEAVAGMAMPLQVISAQPPGTRLCRDTELRDAGLGAAECGAGGEGRAESASVGACGGSGGSDTLRRAVQVAKLLRRGQSEVEGESPLSVVLVEGAGESALVLSVSALYGDAAGVRNLGQELCRCYAARAEGGVMGQAYEAESEDKDEWPAQYADLSEWQNELMESEETAAGREYWRRMRAEAERGGEAGEVRPSGVRGGAASMSVGVQWRELVGAERVRVTEACQKHGVSEGEWLLGCWAAQWWRRRGGVVTIGVRFDGRNYEELENAPGLFDRYLPLSCRLSGKMSVGEVSGRVAELMAEAYQWQECFTWEQFETRAEDSPDIPFLPVCFDYEASPAHYKSAELTISFVRQYSCTEAYEVKLACRSHADRLSIELHYDEGRVTADAAERLLEGYMALINSASSHPGERLVRLEVMGKSERRRLLEEWSGAGERVEEAEGCVHELFGRQAALTPDATAVVCGEQRMSYRELDERSNHLARRLHSLGVGPERPVAVLTERAPRTIVSILAVLKAGGAYLPLDPSSPAERAGHLLADSGAGVLAGRGELLKGLADGARACGAAVIDLDEFELSPTDDGIVADGEDNTHEEPAAGVKVGVDNLAYVIYTSGSTGRPKGVGVTHRQLLSYVSAADRRIGLLRCSSFAVVSTLAADLAHTMLFPALLSGGCLHIVGAEKAGDARLLAGEFSAHPPDCLKIVPGHLRALLDGGAGAGVLPRRRLVLGGERLSRELLARVVRELEASGSGCEVYNHYGPTETTVGAVAGRATDAGAGEGVAVAASGVPLGRPLANARVYVLDAEMDAVPVGVAGELYIGGDGVARGYLNRPGLTAERFVPDPFSQEGGTRLYRTGDVVRYVEGGELEFVGRADDQVKVRGYRVELGEVEAALRELEGVAECVVVAREDEGGDKRLAAYVVRGGGGETGDSVEAAKLRKRLRERLPEYMIPSSFVVLDKLPLTANGKVDKRALPEPEREAGGGGEYVAPRTPAEEVLCGIWAEVLGVERVGVGDDFFEMGGHSLLATQVVSRVREAFGVEVGLREMFERPRVEGLARAVEEARREGAGLAAPEMARVSRGGELPLSFAQQRLWFLSELEPGSAFYNVPTAVRLTGALDVAALGRAFDHLVARHETLRTTFSERDGLPVQVISAPSQFTLPVTDLSHLPVAERETEVRRLYDEEVATPFDLTAGPLLRMKLLRLTEDEHVLLLTMHHIVSDGWSMGVLVRETARLYEAYASGEEPALEALAIQYADFAVWQRQWLRDEALERQLGYWRERLRGAPPVLELPTDFPRPAKHSHHGETHAFELPADLMGGLRALSRQEGVTLFMTLLAVFNVLLHRYTGQEDILVGTNVANRNRAETEGLIGCFINQLVLRTDLSGDPTYRELLGRVRETTLGAYTHQDLPFEKLVEELQPERDRSRSLLFQAKLEVQSAALEQGGGGKSSLTLSPLVIPNKVARYDLYMSLYELPQGMKGSLLYNADLFRPGTIARMVEHFEALLRAVVERPDARLGELTQLLASIDEQSREVLEKELEKAGLQMLKNVRRRNVS
jgi:amino acid adenylation domain-containing protein